jgi:hypothetical protein
MWGLTKQEREQMGPLGILASLEALVAEQGADVEIWEDDSRAWSDEMPDPEADAHIIATSGELLAEYREAVS